MATHHSQPWCIEGENVKEITYWEVAPLEIINMMKCEVIRLSLSLSLTLAQQPRLN
jgi:hypothetical protein